MANRSPETTANGQSSETTVRVLPGSGDSKLFSRLSIFGKLAMHPMGTRKNKRLTELREMEEFELHHWLKDGDEASLEKIHHLGPTENGQIDFKEM
uniref:Uncharacterized protein n=1 Tax=Brassica campestris TaxID=3711 RepID=A0A3P5YUZ0_BRACM|nr:unnamed protein product [Brassica rapa]